MGFVGLLDPLVEDPLGHSGFLDPLVGDPLGHSGLLDPLVGDPGGGEVSPEGGPHKNWMGEGNPPSMQMPFHQ